MRARWLLTAALLAAVGCGKSPREGEWATAIIPGRTPVHLVLLDKIESGVSREGDAVRLVVAEDVRIGDATAIPAGSLATARVVWSRRGDPLRMLANQPSRLAIAFEGVATAYGGTVRLDPGPAAKGPLSIERSMVGPDRTRKGLGRMLEDAAGRAAILELAASLDRGSLPAESSARTALQKVAADLGLSELERAISDEGGNRFDEALRSLRGSTSILQGGGDTLTAILQLASVAGAVGDRVGRLLNAPNIVAQPGTPLSAHTAEATSVRVPATPKP